MWVMITLTSGIIERNETEVRYEVIIFRNGGQLLYYLQTNIRACWWGRAKLIAHYQRTWDNSSSRNGKPHTDIGIKTNKTFSTRWRNQHSPLITQNSTTHEEKMIARILLHWLGGLVIEFSCSWGGIDTAVGDCSGRMAWECMGCDKRF